MREEIEVEGELSVEVLFCREGDKFLGFECIEEHEGGDGHYEPYYRRLILKRLSDGKHFEWENDESDVMLEVVQLPRTGTYWGWKEEEER